MGDEVEDLRMLVLEQGLALEGLQRAAADAEERRRSIHAEILEMMAQMGSGRQQQLSTAVGAGRDASTPASEHSDVGNGSREGERVSAEDGHLGGKGCGSCVGALGVCRRHDGVLTEGEKALRWKHNRRRLRGEWHGG